MKNIINVTWLKAAVAVALIYCVNASFVYADEIRELAKPIYSTKDPAGVNVASGTVSPSLTDVSIGGAMGLSHTISTYTSNFVNYDSGWGFSSNFKGVLYYALYSKPSSNPTTWIYCLRASDGSETVNFKINSNNTFTAYRETSYELKWISGVGFKMIKPDGTEVLYPHTGSSMPELQNLLPVGVSKITYPNGLNLSIKGGGGRERPIYSVKTNTGWQMNFEYDMKTTGLPSGMTDISSTYIPSNSSAGWTAVTPTKIIAFNASEEFCEHNLTYSNYKTHRCSFSKLWPFAEHTWPTGMPRSMYLGDTEFKVKDYRGGTTHFYHKAYDIAVDQNGNHLPGYWRNKGEWFVPRISKIKWPSGRAVTYDYFNDGMQVLISDGGLAIPYGWTSLGSAELKSASLDDGSASWAYGVDIDYSNIQGYKYNATIGGYKSVYSVIRNDKIGTLFRVQSWDKTISFEENARNLPLGFNDNLSSESTSYTYDSRGNIETVTTNGKTTTANYLSCNSTNRKYCNKPSWIKGPKGNATDFSYFSQHGQVKSITKPADQDGVRPHVQYEYEQKTAKVRNSSGSLVNESSSVWMLTKEHSCTKSPYIGDENGNCRDGDDVITQYYYAHNNLLLTKMTVYSEEDNKTLTTCYEYDVYGNQIGATEAKGNCN